VFGCLFIQVPTLFFACAARSHAHASLLLGFSFFIVLSSLLLNQLSQQLSLSTILLDPE
jgi:hypothetical protein